MRHLRTIPSRRSRPARTRLGAPRHGRGAAQPGEQRPEPLIDARAAGRLLGVPHTWVLAQARAGLIPHHRLGHYVRFSRSDLEAWLGQTRLGPPASSRPGELPELALRARRPGSR
jgi:excisionase family DNA binding protein